MTLTKVQRDLLVTGVIGGCVLLTAGAVVMLMRLKREPTAYAVEHTAAEIPAIVSAEVTPSEATEPQPEPAPAPTVDLLDE